MFMFLFEKQMKLRIPPFVTFMRKIIVVVFDFVYDMTSPRVQFAMLIMIFFSILEVLKVLPSRHTVNLFVENFIILENSEGGLDMDTVKIERQIGKVCL